MRGPFATLGLLILSSACGYNPQPGDGLLPCDHGCPTGYVCRSSNDLCYHANAPIPDASPPPDDASDTPKDDVRSRSGDGAGRADGPASDSTESRDAGPTCTSGGMACSDGRGPDSPLKTDLGTWTDATLPRDTRPSDDASDDLPADQDAAGRRDVRAVRVD
jgi:hypothetical protein